MKKHLLTLLAVFLSLASYAAETTVTWSVADQGFAAGDKPTTVELGSGYVATFGDTQNRANYLPQYTTAFTGINVYNGGFIKIEAPTGGAAMKKIVLTFVEGRAGAISANGTALTASGTTYTWEGKETSVNFTNSGSNFTLAGIELTYDPDGGGDEPSGDEPGGDEPGSDSPSGSIITWSVSAQGYSAGDKPTSIDLGQGYTATLGDSQGRSNYQPQYTTVYYGINVYNGGFIKIDAPTGGAAMKKIVLTFAEGRAGAISANGSALTPSGTTYTWEGEETSVNFTNGGSNFTLTGIELTLVGGSDEPGGDEPGGDEPGGDEPGGEEPGGGDEPGGGEEPIAEQTVTWDPNAQGYADMYKPSSATLTEGYTATFGGSGNSTPLYYSGYGGMLFYNTSSVKIEGKAIKKIVLHVNQDYPGVFNTSEGTLNTNATNYTWVGETESVTFTNTGSSARVTGITITFGGGDDPDTPTYADNPSTPATPSVVSFTYSGVQKVVVDVPNKDVDDALINPANLYYKIWKDIEQTVGEVTIAEMGDADLQKSLTADLIEIPYNYTDYYVETVNGQESQRLVYLDNEANVITSYNKIGVQTIYRKDAVTLASEIGWYDIKDYSATTAISTVSPARKVTAAHFDLLGRQMSSSAKGLTIMQLRQPDSSLKTVKVVR